MAPTDRQRRHRRSNTISIDVASGRDTRLTDMIGMMAAPEIEAATIRPGHGRRWRYRRHRRDIDGIDTASCGVRRR